MADEGLVLHPLVLDVSLELVLRRDPEALSRVIIIVKPARVRVLSGNRGPVVVVFA